MNRINLACTLLIKYLKKYGIQHIVISSGTRGIPLIRAIENDEWFQCYSVVDERNAAFFALGISQQINKPVGLVCTSGTAVSNYLSGMTEAFFSHTPLVAITADRSMQSLHQLETQKVDQPAILNSVVLKSVTLPVIKDKEDFWYAKHLLDEAFVTIEKNENGPIHINAPFEGTTDEITFHGDTETCEDIIPVEYYSEIMESKWINAVEELRRFKRILVVIGQNINIGETTKSAIALFCKKLRIPIIGDNLSNFRCENMIFSQSTVKALNKESFEIMLPELVISIGNNFQERIKDLLKAHRGDFRHWLIDEGGIIRDWSRSLSAIFDCSKDYFFSYFNSNSDYSTDGKYLADWRAVAKAAVLPKEMPWSNFYLARRFAEFIPNNSILHLAILNATRLMQFFELPEGIKVSCNASSFGIDGCLPTLLGQSVVAPDKLAFILIGDLSFLYGMNALSIRGVSKNVRILISNNHGGAEFHIFPHVQKDDKIDLHIGASHDFNAKGWSESTGFDYMSANDKESLEMTMPDFISSEGNRPKVLEVFTPLHSDGGYCLEVYRYLEKAIAPTIESIRNRKQ